MRRQSTHSGDPHNRAVILDSNESGFQGASEGCQGPIPPGWDPVTCDEVDPITGLTCQKLASDLHTYHLHIERDFEFTWRTTGYLITPKDVKAKGELGPVSPL
jgi:hypothetical protein